MRQSSSFWALPALLRVALASQHSFHITDDLLAFPQYEVLFPRTFVEETYASSMLAHVTAESTPASSAKPKDSSDLSHLKHNNYDSYDDDNNGLPSTYERLMLGDQPYLCRIPTIDKASLSDSNDTQSPDEEKRELTRATDRGWELLQGMRGNCIYYMSGWWSYSFCYDDGVKQFHQLPPSRGVPIYPPVEDTSVQSFMLGEYPNREKSKEEEKKPRVDDEGQEMKGAPEEKALATLETKGETRYMVQRLGGGTACDLTGRERKIEVQFHCNPSSNDRIGMIKEISTCNYLMVIYTPRLCNDVAFLPPQENKPNPIICKPIIKHHNIEAYNARISGSSSAAIPAIATAAHESPEAEAPLPTIGGIVVGAKASVGFDGHTIEKSVVVGGGKETFIGIVASWDGTQMTQQEMKKHNIRDPRDVEKLKKDLMKLSRGKGWRLELVDTPRGREFRGIIESDDEAEGEEMDKHREDREGQGESDRGREGTRDRPEEEEGGGDDAEDIYGNEGTEEEYYYKEEL